MMETNILREKLTEYIKTADEKKVNALYTILEEEIKENTKWWEDEALLNEMDEDYNKIISGEAKSYSIEEVKKNIQQQKAQFHLPNVLSRIF